MKVLICARGYNSKTENKIGNFELDQAKALKAAGCDVRIASLDLRSPRRRRPHGAKKFACEKMRCVTVSYYCSILPGTLEDKMGRKAAKKAYSLIYKDGWQPDVIHAHFTEIASAFADVAERSSAKFVITEHSSAMNRKDPDPKSLRQAKYSYPKADKVISVSSALAENLRANVGISPEVIGNMVDTKIFEGISQGNSNGSFTFVSCGNLVEIKRFDVLLEAFSKLDDKTARLVIFGDGSEEAKLKELAKQLGISERVDFKGRQPREVIAKEYEHSDAFVLASRSETFGVAFLEAMCMGLPVVATKCGGVEDFVNGENGRLAQVADPGSLAREMQFMITNRSSFDSEKIKQDICRRFSSQSIAEKIIGLYNRL